MTSYEVGLFDKTPSGLKIKPEYGVWVTKHVNDQEESFLFLEDELVLYLEQLRAFNRL
jgi:hypothetical protein